MIEVIENAEELPEGSGGRPFFSLIVCTYNRCEILDLCLASLQLAEVPVHNVLEILVVDNNSQDCTRAAFDRAASCQVPNIQWKYALETRQGLSYARNRGIAESGGEWLVFLDDECVVDPQWLHRLKLKIEQHAPLAIGGPYEGAFLPIVNSSAFAHGFLETYGDSFHLRDQWEEGWIRRPRLSGGNLAIKRDVFTRFGGFHTELGMTGDTIAYGEETEIQQRLLDGLSGNVLYFSPELKLIHFIRPEKANVKACLASAFARAENIAKLKDQEWVGCQVPLSVRMDRWLIFYRRLTGLVAHFLSDLLVALLTRDALVRPLYKAIFSGRFQAFWQAWLIARSGISRADHQ